MEGDKIKRNGRRICRDPLCTRKPPNINPAHLVDYQMKGKMKTQEPTCTRKGKHGSLHFPAYLKCKILTQLTKDSKHQRNRDNSSTKYMVPKQKVDKARNPRFLVKFKSVSGQVLYTHCSQNPKQINIICPHDRATFGLRYSRVSSPKLPAWVNEPYPFPWQAVPFTYLLGPGGAVEEKITRKMYVNNVIQSKSFVILLLLKW